MNFWLISINEYFGVLEKNTMILCLVMVKYVHGVAKDYLFHKSM